MNKISSSGSRSRSEGSSDAEESSNSSSDFSLAKSKKTQRRVHKKRITKMVHTCCVFYLAPDGTRSALYYQRTADSSSRDPVALRNAALRQAGEHNGRVVG